MRTTPKVVGRRPAELTSLGAGGVAATIAALTGMDTTAAAIVVAAVGGIPGLVTFLVEQSRRVTQTAALVELTERVVDTAGNVLESAARTGNWKDQADALEKVVGALSKWSDLLAVQPAAASSDGEE